MAEEPGAAAFSTQKQIAGDIQRCRDGQVLIDGLDAELACVERAFEMDGFSIEQDVAAVGDERAGQCRRQRRPAR